MRLRRGSIGGLVRRADPKKLIQIHCGEYELGKRNSESATSPVQKVNWVP